jgi:hypothetical protein
MPFTTGRKLPFACRDTNNMTPIPISKRQKLDVAIKRHGQELAFNRFKIIRASNGGKPIRGDINVVVNEFSNTIYSKIVTYRTLRFRSTKAAKGQPAFNTNDDYDGDEESINNNDDNNKENDDEEETANDNNDENNENNNDTINVNNILRVRTNIPKPDYYMILENKCKRAFYFSLVVFLADKQKLKLLFYFRVDK